MMHLINRARDDRGLRRLDRDRGLSRTARRHSRATAGSLFHHGCLGCLLGGRPWHIAGENVGRGRSVNRVFEAFMGSAGHRANIVRAGYRKVGGGDREDGWLDLGDPHLLGVSRRRIVA
jgi:uncharacterized protein YkwD